MKILFNSNEFEYLNVKERVYVARDSLLKFLASYTDDKGSVYFFDPSEIDSNESFAKQLVSSSQKISPSDTALMRRIYTLFELPKMLAFEEGGSEFSILQKELFLKTLVSNVLLAKDLGLNRVLTEFYSPGGYFRIIPKVLESKQVFSQVDSLSISVRFCAIDSILRDENYYNLNNENFLFTENNLTIKVSEKGPQKITGTLGVAEKGVLIQKPWSYTFHVE